MSGFRITKAAKQDLVEIAAYTFERWGDAQRRRYLAQLDARFHRLAKKPALGLPSDDIRPGYWRYQEGRHVIFYRRAKPGIEIIRVLHVRMLPERHL